MTSEVQVLVPFRQCLEGVAAGLAYAGALAALGVFAAASFRPWGLSSPYWSRIGWLRTDTFGLGCFITSALTFGLSEFLRLTRNTNRRSPQTTRSAGPVFLITLAAGRALVVASSALVAYLSVNAITHPQTLALPATHLLSWPTEGTLRVVALIVTAFAVAVVRIQQISMGGE